MNGAINKRLRHECALCDAYALAAKRHTARPRSRTRRLLPWAAAILLCIAVTPFVDGLARGLLLGLVAGLLAGTGLAWASSGANRHLAAKTLASMSEEMKAEADQRAAMVIRQFEWAVNDVANLRDALTHAQDARAVAEVGEQKARRRLLQLERQLNDARTKIGEYSRALGPDKEAAVEEPTVLPSSAEIVVPLMWRSYEEDMLTWLRFESDGVIPSQIRILNEHDSVIAISSRALDTVEDGAKATLVVRAPDNVVATLEGRHQGRFTFEALVDDSWRRVELKAVPVKKEKRRRLFRSDDERRPQALIA